MNKTVMQTLIKTFVLFGIGGIVYNIIEMLYRGNSHWTMTILGGISFIIIGLINKAFTFDTPLWKQMAMGAVIITTLELFCGVIVNIGLGWHVWDYSNLPFNIFGQICLPFTLIWFFLSIVAIVADDYIRYWLFDEEKPHYKLF